MRGGQKHSMACMGASPVASRGPKCASAPGATWPVCLSASSARTAGNWPRRLAIGFTGALMAGALLIGTVSVAADDGTVEPHDVNIGAEATGLANGLSTYTINSVAAPATPSDVEANAAPPVEGASDRLPDASAG